MIRRTLILCSVLLSAVCLGAGVAAPARAASANAQMRDALMAVRGLIDREGASRYFTYPSVANVRAGGLGDGWWPTDPWTGTPMTPGSGRGHYRYRVSADRRRYRLVGHLDGGVFVLTGGMPRSIMLAYDHRSEEGMNLIRQYVEAYAAVHGVYPRPADVEADGAVGIEPVRRYWPSNPWDHLPMTQRADHGSFSYEVAPDRTSYTLHLHRALKRDYVLLDAAATSAWQRLFANLFGTHTHAPGVAMLTVRLPSGEPLADGLEPSLEAPAQGPGSSGP